MATVSIQADTRALDGGAGPRVEIEIPDAWERSSEGDALIAALAPAVGATFQLNVTVQYTRREPSVDLGSLGEEMLRRYDGFERWALVASGVSASRSDLWLAEVTFEDRDAGTLIQTHAITGFFGGGSADVFHACGTARPTDEGFDLIGLRACVQSLRTVTNSGSSEETGSET